MATVSGANNGVMKLYNAGAATITISDGTISNGTFKANVSVTDSAGNTVTALGSGHSVTVTATGGTVTGGSLTIAASGPAESTTQVTFTPSNGSAQTLTAATSAGTVYTSATASTKK